MRLVRRDMASKAEMSLIRGDMASQKTAIKTEIGLIRGDMASKTEMSLVRGRIENMEDILTSQKTDMGDVVLIAKGKRVCEDKQTRHQRLFIKILYIVASAGFVKDIKEVFS